jgi:hypothetical protein
MQGWLVAMEGYENVIGKVQICLVPIKYYEEVRRKCTKRLVSMNMKM